MQQQSSSNSLPIIEWVKTKNWRKRQNYSTKRRTRAEFNSSICMRCWPILSDKTKFALYFCVDHQFFVKVFRNFHANEINENIIASRLLFLFITYVLSQWFNLLILLLLSTFVRLTYNNVYLIFFHEGDFIRFGTIFVSIHLITDYYIWWCNL